MVMASGRCGISRVFKGAERSRPHHRDRWHPRFPGRRWHARGLPPGYGRTRSPLSSPSSARRKERSLPSSKTLVPLFRRPDSGPSAGGGAGGKKGRFRVLFGLASTDQRFEIGNEDQFGHFTVVNHQLKSLFYAHNYFH